MSPISHRQPLATSWARFRLLLAWSAGFGLAAAGGALWWIETAGTALRLHLMLALGGGIFLAVMLAGALMGLVFLSNRTGHDEEAGDLYRHDSMGNDGPG